MSIDTWRRLRDAIYVAETATADAGVDLLEANSAEELTSIVADLRAAIDGVVQAAGEPLAVADPD